MNHDEVIEVPIYQNGLAREAKHPSAEEELIPGKKITDYYKSQVFLSSSFFLVERNRVKCFYQPYMRHYCPWIGKG